MKYTQHYRRKKFKLTTGFYAVVACCLVIIGGASWFSLSKISNTTVNSPKNKVSQKEYQDNTSSYIESVPEIPEITVPTEETQNQQSNVPHSNNEETVVKPEEPKLSFTMPVQGEIIKEFSIGKLIYSATYGDMRIHKGIDISCENGTQISACGDGVVLAVVKDASLGNIIEIDHGNGIVTKYSAINKAIVKEGDNVKLGDIIGDVTTVPSECEDKTHLHLEVYKDNKIVSPLDTLGLS